MDLKALIYTSGPEFIFGSANAYLISLGTHYLQGSEGLGMSCRDTIHLICWYLEGRLSSSVEAEIRRHLETCADCHMVLEAAVNTLDRYFNSEQRALTAEGAFRAA